MAHVANHFSEERRATLAATTRTGVLGMERIEPASLAYKRSFLATNPATTCENSNRRDSVTDWSLPLVRGADSRRLPSSSEVLADAGGTGWS